MRSVIDAGCLDMYPCMYNVHNLRAVLDRMMGKMLLRSKLHRAETQVPTW